LAKKNTYQQELVALYRINVFLSSIADLAKLLHLIMEEAAATVRAEASSIALYDSRRKELYFAVALGKKGAKVKEIRIKLGKGILGYAAKSRKPLNIKDVRRDKRFSTSIDKKTGFTSRAILAVPIVHQKKLIGALEVINKKGAASFSAADVRLLEIIASQAAIAIENAQLYEKLLKKHRALQKKHKQFIAAQEKMLTMERLSTIGDMASRIIHDLRNPLSVIRGYAYLQGEDTISDKERKEFSTIIMDEVDRLTGMTNELLEFARGKVNLLFKDQSFGDFIKGVCNYLRRDFEGNKIKLTSDLAYEGPICMDKFKMQRAIFNLTSNAKDAMPQGGTFQIATALRGNQVELTFSDTGCGIPEQIKDKIFEPFVSHGKSHGTGLGMPIVKKIIESHGGSVSIESQPRREGSFSTVITVYLPLKQPEERSS